MESINYYILLDLPFDPPVNDEAEILSAIENKRKQWSRDANHPFRREAARYLGMLDEIKAVMLDPAARSKEAEKAKEIKREKSKDLMVKLSLHADNENELTSRDIKLLIKDFGPYGFDEKTIKEMFSHLASSKQDSIGEIIDRDLSKNIAKYLSDLGTPDASLYDFLGLSPETSSQELLAAADELRKKLLAKGDKTGSDGSKQQLSGLCKRVFQSEKEKEKYDNYLRITKYFKFNKMIDEAAQTNKRVITLKTKETLLSYALREYAGELELSQASFYLENYCEYMGYTLSGGSVICSACGHENPPGSTVCSKCNRQLMVICPRCGSRNDNVTRSCIKCGFDLSKIDSVNQLIDHAKEAVSSKEYSHALECLKKAKLDWPDHPDIAPLEKIINKYRQGFEKAQADIAEAISNRNYYAAKALVEKAQSDGYEISSDIISKVDSIIKETEEKLRHISSMSKGDSFRTLTELSLSISDSSEVQQMLKQFPPEAPSGLRLHIRGNEVYVEWDKSESDGDIEYVLVRKENGYSNSVSDGVVYAGKECSYTDDNVPKSTELFYSVYARRIGIPSVACRAIEPVVLVEPLSVKRCIGGDSKVDITWTCSSTVSEVKLWRCRSIDQPSSDSFVNEVPCNRLDGISIKNLENGSRYWFKLVAFHNINGKSYASGAIIVNAIPLKPAEPIEGFTVEYKEDRFYAAWLPTEWDVILFCSEEKPSYVSGTIYDLREIDDNYQRLDLNMTGDNNAEFTFDFVGQRYIIPGIINATNVVLSDSILIANIPKISNASYDFSQGATDLYIEFDWPQGIDNAIVLIRTDAYPEDPNDPVAFKYECNKKHYDANASISLHDIPVGMLYASIYTFVNVGDKRIYSQDEKLLINNEPQRSVFYSFRYKKPGFISKVPILTVEVKSDGSFIFPQFVIVAKNNGVPLRRDDGITICAVSERTEIDRAKSFEFEIQKLKKETKLKMFFVNDKDYKKYKIQNSGSSSF